MDTQASEVLRKILKDNGYSMTTPRRTVCELLWGQEPVTMTELAARSRGKLDRASLYRVLDVFERLGLIQRVYMGWKYKIELSDILTHHHHHISCTVCGRIVALNDEQAIERMIAALAARHGFTATRHQLEIQGRCTACMHIS
jgi:Fur family ferric uptake transcriptional regulator